MNLPLVSIIIPIYNVKKFINCCVDSVCNQTYKNLDIILVDDGSQDGSAEICDQYATMDPRIQSLHKENGGLSDARNYGMKYVRGDFVFFLDGDDFVYKDAICHLVNVQIENNSDIAIGNMVLVAESVTNDFIYHQDKTYVVNLNSEQAIEETIYQKKFSCSVCGNLYRKSVLTTSFPLGKLSEDLAVAHIFISEANVISYSNKVCYFYRQRSNSIMHQFNPRRIDALDFALNVEKFCKQNYKNLALKAQCRVFNISVHLLLDMDANYIHSPNELIQKVVYELKRTRMQVLLDPKCRFREKAVAVISFLGINVIRFLGLHFNVGRRKIHK